MQKKETEERLSTLKRAFLMFEHLGNAHAAMSLEEICHHTGIPKPTAYRMLTELVQMNYMTKTNHRYEIGVRFLSLAKSAFHGTRDVRDLARRHMLLLRETYGESVNFAVWEKKHAVLIASEPSRHPFRIENKIGQVFPLHCTTIGKVIAAHLPWSSVKEIVERDGMPEQTPNTITDPQVFQKELEQVRAQGYALDDEESVEGVRCTAVPIFRSGNVIYGGMSISGPVNRMPGELIEQMAKDLQIAGYRISFELSSASE
jgi:IclR family acetate operon transcriptional repressor